MKLFTGREYLKIDIASNFGLDKKSWKKRISWFDEHEERLDQLVPAAETPALFYAGVQAWKAVKRGEPIGYPVSFDATSSGLQLLACLVGDRSAAELCNVVNTFDEHGEATRSDAYTLIYKLMMDMLGEGAKISRDDVKKAIMTALYGSKAQPKRVFGEGEQLTAFYTVMQDVAPGAWELNELFLEIWDATATSNDWVLPDNFHVHIKIMENISETVQIFNEPVEVIYKVNAPKKNGRSLGANTIHSIDGMIVREIARRCDYDLERVETLKAILNDECDFRFVNQTMKREAHKMVPILWDHYKKSGYLSARILDYLDSDTMQMVNFDTIQQLVASLPPKPFKVISTHDCFRALPQYMNDVRRQYNLQLHNIAKSNMLNFVLSQLLKQDVTIGKLDESLAQDVLASEYALS